MSVVRESEKPNKDKGFRLVGVAGFEPATTRTASVANGLSHIQLRWEIVEFLEYMSLSMTARYSFVSTTNPAGKCQICVRWKVPLGDDGRRLTAARNGVSNNTFGTSLSQRCSISDFYLQRYVGTGGRTNSVLVMNRARCKCLRIEG